MIFISGVIIYSLVTVAARSVNSVFELTVCNFTTAFLLFNRTKNMKKLTYTFRSPDNEFVFTNAALTNLDCDDKSPGKPIDPIPRLYIFKFNLSEKLFLGDFGDKFI